MLESFISLLIFTFSYYWIVYLEQVEDGPNDQRKLSCDFYGKS